MGKGVAHVVKDLSNPLSIHPKVLVSLEELAISTIVGDLGAGGIAGAPRHPDQAGRAGHDPGAAMEKPCNQRVSINPMHHLP